MEILLGNFNAKVEQADIFKPTVGKASLHEVINDKVVCPNANPLHYYALRVQRKAERWR